MANTYINRNFPSSGNRTTWTLSMWVKRSLISSEQMLAHAYYGANDYTKIRFEGDDILNFENYTGGTRDIAKRTNRMFRDTSAFYHLLFVNSPSAQTIYVNGVEETSWRTNTTGNVSTWWNHNISNTMFASVNGGSLYFSGVVSHVHFCDGTALAPTVFGEYDANGVWKIKTSPSFTLGTNGFTILKDGNTITDQSTNSNAFTLGGGTLTNTEDSPSNVFATMNPLGSGAVTFSNGNNTVTKSGAGWLNAIASLGASSGKYYAEAKAISIGGVTYGSYTGFTNLDVTNAQNTTSNFGETNDTAGISSGGGYIYYNTGTQFAGPTTATTNGDIVNLAMDLDNGFLYWGINGTYVNSGNPASGSTGTGGMAISYLTADGTYTFGQSIREGANYSWNFGNGYFGTTAVASAGTNASGIGIFEYDVPTGFTALSTKGLNL